MVFKVYVLDLQLIKKGIPVTIFDRHDPLSEQFSLHLMEMLGISHLMQSYNLIDQISYNDVPKMLFSSNGPLAFKWNYIFKNDTLVYSLSKKF